MPKQEFFEDIKSMYSEAASVAEGELGSGFDCAVVLGSGISSAMKNIEVVGDLPYSALPGMPRSSVDGHANRLTALKIASKKALAFSGRFHLYEGFGLNEILAQVVIASRLGIKNIVFTNAGGALDPAFSIGDIMLVSDTINATNRRITATVNHVDGIGPTFITEEWRKRTKSLLMQRNIYFREGILVSVTGPNYETPAEIRYYRKTGASAIGMSTVHEAFAARLLGMSAIACTLITNVLHDTDTAALGHEDVVAAAAAAEKKLSEYILAAIETCLPD